MSDSLIILITALGICSILWLADYVVTRRRMAKVVMKRRLQSLKRYETP